MGDRPLVDRKLDASTRLAEALIARGSPLLGAYWEWRGDDDRWVLVLVPQSQDHERQLISSASELLTQPPYRSIFSVSDAEVDARQIRRAQALGAYIRSTASIGRQIDTLFTGGEYFDAVVPIYLAPELSRATFAS